MALADGDCPGERDDVCQMDPVSTSLVCNEVLHLHRALLLSVRYISPLQHRKKKKQKQKRRHYISRHDWIWWLRRFYGVNASALSYRSVCFDSNAIVAYKRKENLGRQLGCCCQHGDTHSWDLVSLLAATKDNFRVFGRRRRVFWNSHSWAYTQTDVIKK